VYGNITICNFSLTDSIQLRWLVTSQSLKIQPIYIWSLDNVKVTLITESMSNIMRGFI